MGTEIGLARAIRGLRAELAEAMADGEDEAIRFRIESISLDLQVAVENAREGHAGLRFWVVSADGGASSSTVTTHSLSLQLAAETAAGDHVRIAATPERRPD
ncbi:trypco2 family protein [Streptomyces buecherae]|uniref:trypco2 family protein n=1 Tax=Streptomyces buecherae TaxID=2763006 RepID=UPI0033D76786